MLAIGIVLSLLTALTSAAIQWGNCSSSVPLNSPALQCAELSVPLNWTDPRGQNITLGLTRVQAKNATDRIGSLILNPGGPGVPAATITAGQALGFPFFPPNISSVFDIIGMDPRGVGLSTPVVCDPDLWNQRVTSFPTSQEEYDELVTANKAIWESCANLTGPLLFNVDTTSVTKDLEAVRIALDDGPLNFLGISYGSVIAQTYAQMYPDSYRTIAMDAVVDHNSSATDLFFAEAQTYESSLHRFAAWCNTTNTTVCPLFGQDVVAVFAELIANTTETPLKAPGCNGNITAYSGCKSNITAEEILFVTQDLLLFKDPNPPVTPGWPGLAQVLGLAALGNGTAYSQAYASQFLATSNTSSSLFAGQATSCLDFAIDISSFSDVQYRLQLGRYIAPSTRGASQTWESQTRCIGFPHGGPTNPQRDMTVPQNESSASNTGILIVASRWDPSCNFLWAENTRVGIANASLVLRDGDGHTSFLLHGEASGLIDDYFLTGELPPNNTVVKT